MVPRNWIGALVDLIRTRYLFKTTWFYLSNLHDFIIVIIYFWNLLNYYLRLVMRSLSLVLLAYELVWKLWNRQRFASYFSFISIAISLWKKPLWFLCLAWNDGLDLLIFTVIKCQIAIINLCFDLWPILPKFLSIGCFPTHLISLLV